MLARTLSAVARTAARLDVETEVVVVDASERRLDAIRVAHPEVLWIDFRADEDAAVTIPHQRNHGVKSCHGELIVFTDSGCEPQTEWAENLVAPIISGHEEVAAGRTVGTGPVDMYDALGTDAPQYVDDVPTINLAFTRRAFEAVHGFDESFAYGSDVDFAWRLRDAGYRIRYVSEAIVFADWGSRRRQLKRAYSYGRARTRLYRKHRRRIRQAWRTNPVPFVYGAFILGLPLSLRYRAYPLLLVIPALRNRRTGVMLTVADHVLQGAGFLREIIAR